MFSQIQLGKYSEAIAAVLQEDQIVSRMWEHHPHSTCSAGVQNAKMRGSLRFIPRFQKATGNMCQTLDSLHRDSKRILYVSQKVRPKLLWRPRILKMPSMQGIH